MQPYIAYHHVTSFCLINQTQTLIKTFNSFFFKTFKAVSSFSSYFKSLLFQRTLRREGKTLTECSKKSAPNILHSLLLNVSTKGRRMY